MTGGRSGTLVVEQIESRVLAGNPLGDPAVRRIPVYLPPDYDRTQAAYPVIYWLHGFTGTALAAINYNPWVPSLPECMDRAMAAGAPPAILVMVDGFTKFGGSQYLNSEATGRYEDFVVHELVAYVDRRYRTLPSPAHRGIDGKSSGGYGALVLAMRHPDVFGAAASHSGDMLFEACYLPDFWKFCATVGKYGGVEAFLRAFLEMPKKTPEALTAVNIAAMAMAYSPNPARPPFFFDLPVDPTTGEIVDATWQRWLARDPVRMAGSHADALRRLRLLYFECGTRDQYNLHFGARALHRRLEALGVAHEYREFDDDHSGINYRYVESLRRLCDVLAP
ncbi:MAG: alpha/beta hydrolase-fold protein [Armatimonadota bacterium]|nr:alpha/beta hydrolase-fold protein [Armatimonadota bacterium]MDR7532006.1 alpha/beta hydrolase-fold protein [Armatimonadota bacterium]MDR7535937.1 alpha/beta hydrolase-fold protein [Armatimonadota bacterium]